MEPPPFLRAALLSRFSFPANWWRVPKGQIQPQNIRPNRMVATMTVSARAKAP